MANISNAARLQNENSQVQLSLFFSRPAGDRDTAHPPHPPPARKQAKTAKDIDNTKTSEACRPKLSKKRIEKKLTSPAKEFGKDFRDQEGEGNTNGTNGPTSLAADDGRWDIIAERKERLKPSI